MASIRARKDNDLLFFDFRFQGKRYREQTLLKDTKLNRKKMEEVLEKIEKDISSGDFDFNKYFPKSNSPNTPETHGSKQTIMQSLFAENSQNLVAPAFTASPYFKDFSEKWFDECKIGWRKSYVQTMRDTIDKHLLPYFGEKVVSSIRREDILDFRSQLAKVPGRKGQTLSARRINAIVLGLRQMLLRIENYPDKLSSAH